MGSHDEKGEKAPIPKNVLMRQMRAKRQSQGLVKVEIWDTPENCEKVKRFRESLKTYGCYKQPYD